MDVSMYRAEQSAFHAILTRSHAKRHPQYAAMLARLHAALDDVPQSA